MLRGLSTKAGARTSTAWETCSVGGGMVVSVGSRLWYGELGGGYRGCAITGIGVFAGNQMDGIESIGGELWKWR